MVVRLQNNKVGGRLELISNLMVLETCAMTHFATVQGGKHRQHIIELFAIKSIQLKQIYLNKSIFENTF